MIIEQATSEHLEAILQLLSRADLPTEGVAGQLRHFRVALDGPRVAGVIGLETYGEQGLLRSLVVDPERRGQGVGDRLVADLLADARRRGIADIYLLTETAPDYFARRQFERIDRQAAHPAVRQSSEFTTLCPASAVCMRRRLSGDDGQDQS